MWRTAIVACVLIGVVSGECAAQPAAVAAGEAGAAQTGAFTTQIAQRSEHSALEKIRTRMGWSDRQIAHYEEYDLEQERFSVYVPETYDPGKPAGVVVWISPGQTGEPQQPWLGVLGEHNLIWIGADNAGNERPMYHRMALAFDALAWAQANYRVDERRIYLAGFSGGARTASMLAVQYPDVFHGCFAMCGVNYFRQIASPDNPGHHYIVVMDPPSDRFERLGESRSRFVLFTGSRDANRVNTKAVYEDGYVVDGYRHAHYMEVPGLGHAVADAEWFERGIGLLDDNLEWTERERDERAERNAASLLERAQRLIERGSPRGARTLEELVQRFPDTDAAVDARALLAEGAE